MVLIHADSVIQMHAFSSTNFFFLILFGKNLDTFVMDFSRDRRKTPSDLKTCWDTLTPLLTVQRGNQVLVSIDRSID